MLNRNDPVVQFKLTMLERCLPAPSAILFGDIWRIDGGYSVECAERGCERVLLVDSLETPAWQRSRIEHPQIDFLKGDFSNPLFMNSFDQRFDVGVAFDILLHQPGMLGTLTLLLAKVEHRFCVVQPMLEEQRHSGSLVYLPGNPAVSELYPLEMPDGDFQVFDAKEVHHSQWIWAMTPSFLTVAMEGEGFALVEEETLAPMPNPRWSWWGAIYERRESRPPGHWATHGTTPGLWTQPW